MRVGTITRSRRIEGSDQCVEPDAVVARRGATMRDGRGAFHARDVDELAGDQRPCERGRHRRAIAVERTRLQRRKGVIADELITHVDHMGAYGPERQRTLTDLDELAAVANVERNGDDLGLERLRQPRDRDGWVEPTRIGKNYAVHESPGSAHRAEALGNCCRVGCRTADYEDRVVAADGAGNLCQASAVDGVGQRLRLPGVCPKDDELFNRLLGPEVFLDRPPQGRLAARASFDPGPAVSAIDCPLDQPELANIPGKRRLRRVDAALPQLLAQLLLAANCLALNEFQDHGLSFRLHHHTVTN